MAIKVEIKGIITSAKEPKQLKNGKYIQELIISQPAHKNDFNETVGNAQHFSIKKFRNSLSDFDGEDLTDKKVEAECYLNGKEFTTNRGLGYSLQLNLKELKIVD